MTAAGYLYDDFLETVDIVATLLADPAVAAAWDSPSALAEFSVRGLAGHLARPILSTAEALAAPPPAEGECLPVMEHFARSAWIGAGLDDAISVAVRRRGEDTAAAGADELAHRATAAVVELSGILPGQPADRLVSAPPDGAWLLTLPDFLLTRLVELAVHTDDLAVSVGIPGPPLPTRAADTVLGLLTRLAQRRHGTTAVLRALSRAERAPATIAAL